MPGGEADAGDFRCERVNFDARDKAAELGNDMAVARANRGAGGLFSTASAINAEDSLAGHEPCDKIPDTISCGISFHVA